MYCFFNYLKNLFLEYSSSCMLMVALILFSMAWGRHASAPSEFRTIPIVPPV